MKKRKKGYVTIEPASTASYNFVVQDDTPFYKMYPVACMDSMLYYIDEPVFFSVNFNHLHNLAGLIAYFEPNWTDLLYLRVNEKLPASHHIMPDLSEGVFNQCDRMMERIYQVCGGKLTIFDTLYNSNYSRDFYYRIAAVMLLNALKRDWSVD